ncbi:G-protein coupled receptors family 1 profile domain-containing protein [Caenorhabditis elegans]|uniref:G-protein coupled receptors family 1 profile domain-containing protein n=1 Tax=Caenorhabditis elegans TaxID=6239 RepID=O45170_CAEEL|nr:G-protein coupled receptors family 1 profile domain-containing protein [Caenorhabditis elegans]CCD66320.1 G-protein coupled receptors family 1 profile domain-containing protein [Caenorhabditis elegans]|eukprot:NP_503785.3 Serpentine Receptor, class W [Caenorhabditis elegans]
MNQTFESTTQSPNLTKFGDLPSWFDEAEKKLNFVLAILQFFGFGINLVHFSILSRKHLRTNSVYRLMIGICSCDIISHTLTFLAFSPFWIREVRKKNQECFLTMTYRDAVLLLYPVIVLDITQRSSSWLAVLMALYRTLSVKYPMSTKMHKVSNPKWALWTIIGVLVVNTAWTLVVFGRHKIDGRNIDYDCDGNEVHLSQLRFMVLVDTSLEHLHSIITSIYGIIKALPSLIDPILTVLLIIELRKASKRRKNIGKEDCGKSDNTTKLVLFVTISFFILEVPNGFAHVTAGAFHGNPGILTISYMIQVFAEILPVFNSSSHIFICLAMSSQYRETSCEIFCGEKSKTQVVGIYQKIRYYVSNMITDH